MKKLVAFALIAAMVGACGSAQAAKMWDDMTWWGNTGSTPDPVPDPYGRTGYWWYPTNPDSNVDDGELWGNRGIIHCYLHQPEPKPAPKPQPPEPKPQPEPKRKAIVLNNVLFDFDKAILKPEGKAEVDKLVAEMKAHPGDAVVIEGHTCDIGTEGYNMSLGQRRADAVKNYMVEMGIDPNRITTRSYGESQPAVPNTSPANRKLNRRAEFEVSLGEM